jgi:hypothetical protein
MIASDTPRALVDYLLGPPNITAERAEVAEESTFKGPYLRVLGEL